MLCRGAFGLSIFAVALRDLFLGQGAPAPFAVLAPALQRHVAAGMGTASSLSLFLGHDQPFVLSGFYGITRPGLGIVDLLRVEGLGFLDLFLALGQAVDDLGQLFDYFRDLSAAQGSGRGLLQ